MADAPGATIWGVIALPKRMVSVGVIDLTKYIAAQQVAPTWPKRMEFARHMVELEVAQFMVVLGVYFSPECAKVITKTRSSALKSMRMQWLGKICSVIQRRRNYKTWQWHQLWKYQWLLHQII